MTVKFGSGRVDSFRRNCKAFENFKRVPVAKVVTEGGVGLSLVSVPFTLSSVSTEIRVVLESIH